MTTQELEEKIHDDRYLTHKKNIGEIKRVIRNNDLSVDIYKQLWKFIQYHSTIVNKQLPEEIQEKILYDKQVSTTNLTTLMRKNKFSMKTILNVCSLYRMDSAFHIRYIVFWKVGWKSLYQIDSFKEFLKVGVGYQTYVDKIVPEICKEYDGAILDVIKWYHTNPNLLEVIARKCYMSDDIMAELLKNYSENGGSGFGHFTKVLVDNNNCSQAMKAELILLHGKNFV